MSGAWGAYGAGAAAYGAVSTRVADIDDGKVTIHRSQDVEPWIEDVQRRISMGALESKGPDNHRHLASYPPVVVEMYCNTAGITYKEFLRNEEHLLRMLRDPALSKFRVHHGRV